MSAIKVILLLATFGTMVLAFRNRHRVGIRAGVRMLMVGVGAFAIASVLNPSIVQRLADAVGVGRGTDLLLYALIVAFTLANLGFYFRLRALERRLTVVVRNVAVTEAILSAGRPGDYRSAQSTKL